MTYDYQKSEHIKLIPSHVKLSNMVLIRDLSQLACDLMKNLFTIEDRIKYNVQGKQGKYPLDPSKIMLIKNVILHFSQLQDLSKQWIELWKECISKIDSCNRGLKRNIKKKIDNLI